MDGIQQIRYGRGMNNGSAKPIITTTFGSMTVDEAVPHDKYMHVIEPARLDDAEVKAYEDAGFVLIHGAAGDIVVSPDAID